MLGSVHLITLSGFKLFNVFVEPTFLRTCRNEMNEQHSILLILQPNPQSQTHRLDTETADPGGSEESKGKSGLEKVFK